MNEPSDPTPDPRPDPTPPEPQPAELDAVGRQLQAAMLDATPAVAEADAATVAAVRRRVQLRRRVRVGASALVAATILLAGVAVVATREERTTRGRVVGQPASMTSTQTVVVTSGPMWDPNATGVPETMALDPSAPGSTAPSAHGPITTIPTSGSTTPTTSVPTGPRDCGSYGPGGWPTTFVYSPDAARCLLDGFNTGAANTFHLVIADTSYDGLRHDHLITEDYTIVGVHLVQVRVDRTLADAAPRTVVTYRCGQLSYQFGAGAVYHYGDCTVVG